MIFSMAAPKLNLIGDDAIEQGIPFILELWLDDGAQPNPNSLDLTGWSFVSQIRDQPGGTLLGAWDISTPNPSDGKIVMEISGATSVALPAKGFDFFLFFDVRAVRQDGTPILLCEGRLQVNPVVSG
jgi:hypothetical protein